MRLHMKNNKSIRSLKCDMSELWKEIFHDSDDYIALVIDDRLNLDLCEVHYDDSGKLSSMIVGIPYKFISMSGDSLLGLYLCGVSTRPESRGHGEIQSLMHNIEVKAAERGFDFLFLIPANRKLRHFYTRFNFVNMAFATMPRVRLNDIVGSFTLKVVSCGGDESVDPILTAITVDDLMCINVHMPALNNIEKSNIEYTISDKVLKVEKNIVNNSDYNEPENVEDNKCKNINCNTHKNIDNNTKQNIEEYTSENVVKYKTENVDKYAVKNKIKSLTKFVDNNTLENGIKYTFNNVDNNTYGNIIKYAFDKVDNNIYKNRIKYASDFVLKNVNNNADKTTAKCIDFNQAGINQNFVVEIPDLACIRVDKRFSIDVALEIDGIEINLKTMHLKIGKDIVDKISDYEKSQSEISLRHSHQQVIKVFKDFFLSSYDEEYDIHRQNETVDSEIDADPEHDLWRDVVANRNGVVASSPYGMMKFLSDKSRRVKFREGKNSADFSISVGEDKIVGESDFSITLMLD